jgi:hypothetical protein
MSHRPHYCSDYSPVSENIRSRDRRFAREPSNLPRYQAKPTCGRRARDLQPSAETRRSVAAVIRAGLQLLQVDLTVPGSTCRRSAIATVR